MTDLIDKLIISIACLTLYAANSGYGISVTPLIISLSISALNSYYDKKVLTLVSLGAYIMICQWQPEFLVFLPLICYDVFVTNEQLFSLLVFIPIVYHFNQGSLALSVLTILFLLISYFIKFRSQEFAQIKSQFNNYRDNSQELSILLKKKNNDLMDRQDYEINNAMLNDRNRIAMEIHDNVGHLLSRCLLQIGAIMTIIKNNQLKENLSSVKDTMSQAMDTIRNSVHDLHDEAIDLYSQINGLVNNFTYCTIHLDYDLGDYIDTKLKYCFIAIFKEALSNIIKHSCATEVNVILREHPALYQLIIHDNGRVSGYNSDKGIGLTNITHRVRTFNGIIHISTENGFKIFISIPKLK